MRAMLVIAVALVTVLGALAIRRDFPLDQPRPAEYSGRDFATWVLDETGNANGVASCC